MHRGRQSFDAQGRSENRKHLLDEESVYGGFCPNHSKSTKEGGNTSRAKR